MLLSKDKENNKDIKLYIDLSNSFSNSLVIDKLELFNNPNYSLEQANRMYNIKLKNQNNLLKRLSKRLKIEVI